MNDKKILTIVAGPNGSGKSTFAESFFNDIYFVNPDKINEGLSGNKKMSGVASGRLALEEIRRLIQNEKKSFGFETTMSGVLWLEYLELAKSADFIIEIYFVLLNDLEENKRRIKIRSNSGGHDIDVSIQDRRYLKTFNNFWNLYKPKANNWYIVDNSGSKPILITNKNLYEKLSPSEQNLFQSSFVKGLINVRK